jgi:hypothetical protein
VTGADAPYAGVGAWSGERLQDGFETSDVGLAAAGSDTVAILPPPLPAAHARVNEAHSLLRKRGGSVRRRSEVAVSAVDDEVARVEETDEGVDDGTSRIAGWQHQPDDAGRGQSICELTEVVHHLDVLGANVLSRLRSKIVADNAVASVSKTDCHPSPHSAQTNQTNIHWCGPILYVQ